MDPEGVIVDDFQTGAAGIVRGEIAVFGFESQFPELIHSPDFSADQPVTCGLDPGIRQSQNGKNHIIRSDLPLLIIRKTGSLLEQKIFPQTASDHTAVL